MLRVVLSSCCFDCALKAPQGNQFHQPSADFLRSPGRKKKKGGCCDLLACHGGAATASLQVHWPEVANSFRAQKGEPLWFRWREVEENLPLQLRVARPFWNSDEDYKPSVFIAHNAICQGDTVMTGSRCLDPSAAEKPSKENPIAIFVLYRNTSICFDA